MEELLKLIAGHIALAVETVAVLIVTFGALEALLRTLTPLVTRTADRKWTKHVWVDFGRWLLLALQFALAADIVRSAISPNWEDIGHLAAIAAIRTFLSYFLEKDLKEIGRSDAG
jgi:uncharacterized membrane protein